MFFLSLLIYAKRYFACDTLATLVGKAGSTRVSIPGGGLPCRWGHFCFLSSSERLYLPRAAWHLAPLCRRKDAQATGNNRRAIREARLRVALPLKPLLCRPAGANLTQSLSAAFSSLIGANCAIGMLDSSFRVSVGMTRLVLM